MNELFSLEMNKNVIAKEVKKLKVKADMVAQTSNPK